MYSRFTLPVLVSSAVHAGLFGLDWEKTPRTEPVVVVDEKVVFVLPKEPPAEVELFSSDAAAMPKGNPDAGRVPELEEYFSSHRVVFEMPRREVKITAPVDGTRIPRGEWGDPMGTDDWTGVPVLKAGALDRPPQTRVRVAPVYPSDARASGLTGEVWVEFVVDEAGRVMRPRVLRSTDGRFEAATLRAVEKWRFEPGTHQGRPVRFRMAVPVVFSLEA